MTPVVNPWLIYIIDLADTLKFSALFLGVGLGIWQFLRWLDSEKVSGKVITVTVLALWLALFVPTSKTITKMIVAQNVTYERMEIATDTVQRVYEDIMELFEEDK